MALFKKIVLLHLFVAVQLVLSQVDKSVVFSGEYQIIKCNAGQPNSMASKLQTLLPKIWTNLQGVLADAAKGTSSTHGYSAFFKTNDNLQTVQTAYQNMAAGKAVSVTASSTSQGRNINPLNLARPSIVCLQEGDPSTAEQYLACTTGPLAGHLLAGTAAQFVMLCPNFFVIPEEPNVGACPRLRRNTMTPNDDSLVLNQQTQLVHELAHVYGIGGGVDGRGRNWRQGEYEPYLLQEVIDLNASDSVNNAQNFAFYYAGKFSSSILS